MKLKERITNVKIAQRRMNERERYGKVLSGVRTLSAKILTDSEKISSIVIALGNIKIITWHVSKITKAFYTQHSRWYKLSKKNSYK
jgi:hypothetical protein